MVEFFDHASYTPKSITYIEPQFPKVSYFDSSLVAGLSVKHWHFAIDDDHMLYYLASYYLSSDYSSVITSEVDIDGIPVFYDRRPYGNSFVPSVTNPYVLAYPSEVDIYVQNTYASSHTYMWAMLFWRVG